jgi:hypothetical protein
MFCEAYRKPLTDAAAAGCAIEETLQSHLARCEACAFAFSQEQALLAAMDAGLSHLVNTQAPPSLLPRVREAVSRERAPSRGLLQSWLWMPAASAAALVLAALLPRVLPPFPVADPVVLVQPPPSGTGASLNVTSPESPHRHAPPRRLSPVLRAAHSNTKEPEILVPAGEEAALVKYAALLQRQSDLARSLSGRGNQKPLAIEPLEIAALEAQEIQIEPLVRDSDDLSK